MIKINQNIKRKLWRL